MAIGHWLFQRRSWTPLPLLAAIFAYLTLDTAGPAAVSSSLERQLNGLSLAVLFAGMALRLAVVGRAPEGTSGRGRRLEARVLVTWGAYAWTRNPLYFGNLLMCLGLVIEIRSLVVALGVLAFFYLQYAPVIRAEEAFLQARFGEQFEEWASRTPRFWPRPPSLSDPPPPGARLRPGLALLRDADTWYAGLGGWLLWQGWVRPLVAHIPPGSWTTEGPRWTFAAITAVYLGVKLTRRLRRRSGKGSG